MSLAISSINEHQPGDLISFVKNPPDETKQSLLEIIKSDKTKKIINYAFNGSSTTFSLLTFLNGNFHFFDSIQERLEKFSEILAKVAFSKVSLIGAIDLWEKKNPFPFFGYALSVPLAFISSGYNLWLTSGIASGFCNFIVITDQREVVDEKGEPILDKDGNIQIINGDFGDRGWKNAFSTTFNECLKMTRELIEKPERIKKISHAALVSSVFQILGPVIGLSGFEKIGSFIRNAATIAVEGSMLLHKDIKNKSSKNNHDGINLKSPVAQSGLLWVGAAVIDFLKRFDFISEQIKNLTHLTLGLDRAASILFTKSLFDIKRNNT